MPFYFDVSKTSNTSSRRTACAGLGWSGVKTCMVGLFDCNVAFIN
jgi:hypothetical protein